MAAGFVLVGGAGNFGIAQPIPVQYQSPKDVPCIECNSFPGPQVAGIAALMLSERPSMTVWRRREILERTAHDLGSGLLPAQDPESRGWKEFAIPPRSHAHGGASSRYAPATLG